MESNSVRIIRATRFMRLAHGKQQRKGSDHPYWWHPARVGSRVAALDVELGDDLTATEDLVIAALLHDTVEDTHITLTDIAKEFGSTVTDYVDALTDRFTYRKCGPAMNRAARKEKERERLSLAPVEIRAVKFIDRIDNLIETDFESDFAIVYADESKALADILKPGLPKLESELRLEIASLQHRVVQSKLKAKDAATT